MTAIIEMFKDLLTTKGRIPRSTFWWFHGFLIAYLAFLGFLEDSRAVPASLIMVLSFLGFPLLLMRIIVEVKRWHDRDKSGWWVLIGFIPCFGFVWIIIECGLLPGTKGPNRFGPDPLDF